MYIVRFLHQTTTTPTCTVIATSCISSVSYIKPQLVNHIAFAWLGCISSVSYIKPQLFRVKVLFPTCCISSVSYIKPQLPSSCTPNKCSCISSVSYIKPQPLMSPPLCKHSCISSVSYIKPQPIISNKLYTNILLILFIIKNGRVGFVSIAKILKKLQLNRFADDFFCDFA